MRLLLRTIYPANGESVWMADGEDERGQRWRFAGDWRAMADLLDAFGPQPDQEVPVEVDTWQLLGGPM